MRARLVTALALLLGAACRSAPEDPAPPARAALREAQPWTPAFGAEAVLVADEIRIEGPFDLVDHVALRQDPETTVYSEKTVPDGLLQELLARAGAGRELHAQLDAWSLAALRRITVLRRPGDGPVTVRALGSAYWAAADGSAERREPELVFRGTHGLPGP
jgi:hypothetical protein